MLSDVDDDIRLLPPSITRVSSVTSFFITLSVSPYVANKIFLLCFLRCQRIGRLIILYKDTPNEVTADLMPVSAMAPA
jgi:hypothetical protein